MQSLAHQPGSGQDGDVEAARDAGDKPRCCQPSLAPGLYSRAGSGLCSAPNEGKQQLCFLWRARTEQKSLSSALRENVSRARLGGEVPRSPLSCRFHSHYAHLGNLSPDLAKNKKHQGVSTRHLPDPETKPLLPPSRPLKGEEFCFLVILALNAIFSKDISPSFPRKAEPTCPHQPHPLLASNVLLRHWSCYFSTGSSFFHANTAKCSALLRERPRAGPSSSSEG